jgi:UDP-N-acetylmuramate: L-alanyl-gamma-D-glutamyl-meso-diaminopimelate ligase
MKKVHFIGICGKGMSSVAKLLMDSGLSVTGSDEGFYPPVSTYLTKFNIPCATPHKKENIPEDIDTIVIGKHAKLVSENNEEVAYAFELQKAGKVQIFSFPEVLEQLTKDRENLVVAGSYGKSTCTSLLAHILENSGLDIGYFIGATPITPESNAHLGTHKYFVLEGDEYPSANWDSTSKFMYYHPKSVLLTSMAHDHTNIFKTHNEFIQVFYDLINELNEKSYLEEDNNKKFSLVLCLDDATIQNNLYGIQHNLQSGNINLATYALERAEFESKDPAFKIKTISNYYAKNIVFGEKTTFDLIQNFGAEKKVTNFETRLLGKHNIQNIIGVCAFIIENNLLENLEDLRKGVDSFVAVEGRLNELLNNLGVKMFEGFGSSVDKARSAIEAMLLHFPGKKLKIIFEPHTFSWRNKEAIHWYDTVFKGAEKVYVYEPPHHGSNTITQSTQGEIVDRIKGSGVVVEAINDHESAIEKISEDLDKENDIVLTLSSGNFDGLIEKLQKENI